MVQPQPVPLLPRRLLPVVWVLYGLSVDQLGNSNNVLVYNGMIMTVKKYVADVDGYYWYLRWYILLFMVAYAAFCTGLMLLGLRYTHFVKR